MQCFRPFVPSMILSFLLVLAGCDSADAVGGENDPNPDGGGDDSEELSDTFSDARVLSDELPGANRVDLADFDGDGDLDVVVAPAFSREIALFENSGGQLSESTRLAMPSNPRAADAHDLDGDGDLDLLSVLDDEIVWLPNTGDGSFETERVLAGGGDLSELDDPSDTAVADFDSDGDLDVVATFTTDFELQLFENAGAGVYVARRVSESRSFYRKVHAADLDGDGREDLIVMTQALTFLSLFPNTGGTFDDQRMISISAGVGPLFIDTADLDGDGDLDLLLGNDTQPNLVWYANAGDGTFGEVQVISNGTDRVFSADTADFDGDGDLDVVATFRDNNTSTDEDDLMWFENLGDGFAPGETLFRAADGADDVRAGDLTGDGRPDVVAALTTSNTAVWFENLGN